MCQIFSLVNSFIFLLLEKDRQENGKLLLRVLLNFLTLEWLNRMYTLW
jgi:hypothetical protein